MATTEEQVPTVLIIDDGAVTRQALKLFFQRLFFNVVTASDGYEGLKKVMEVHPSLIVLDLLMPNFDGMQVLRTLRNRASGITTPVIIISAHTDRQHVVAAVEAGANAVLSKPFNEEVLHKKLNDLMGEDFMKKVRRLHLLRENERFSTHRFTLEDQKRLTLRLAKHFVSLFNEKRNKIRTAIELKHTTELGKVAHELKGSGGTVGYDDITLLGAELEDLAKADPVDWKQVEDCFERIKVRFVEIGAEVQKKIEDLGKESAQETVSL
jgi:two-component system, OmpR family, response regulator ArlR